MRTPLATMALWIALSLGGARTAGAEPPPRFGDGVQSKRVPIQAPKDRPAKGAPYNWTQMAYGAGVMLIMLAGLLYIIRRSTRDRKP
jgi:hypothetical protein